MVQAQGVLVDDESRCVHYHTDKDIVALQCYECQKYYACYQCHNALETHTFTPYPLSLKEDRPILCGSCKKILTYEEYSKKSSCPYCKAAFNPACQNHYSIYFR